MPNEIVLTENGMVECRTVSISSRGTVSDFAKIIRESVACDPVMLPHVDRGCACFASDGNRKFYMIYLEPRKRILAFNPEDGHAIEEFQIVNPHMYVGVFFRRRAVEGGYVFFARKKVFGIEDPIGAATLPNIYNDGRVCEGYHGHFDARRDPIENVIPYAEYFLKSNFTAHLAHQVQNTPKELWNGGEIDRHSPVERRRWQREVFRKWQELSLSENGVEKITSIEWPTDTNIQEFIRRMWGKGG